MQSKTNYMIMAYKVLDIANKLLLRAKNNESGDLMSNMKLQKMLYYQQGFHLAYFGTPLFDEDIEAWMYGPVVPSVYSHYKNCGRQGIMPETEEELPLDKKEEHIPKLLGKQHLRDKAISSTKNLCNLSLKSD